MVIALIVALSFVGIVIGFLTGGAMSRFGGTAPSVLGPPALFIGACVLAAGGFSSALTVVGCGIAGFIFGLIHRIACK